MFFCLGLRCVSCHDASTSLAKYLAAHCQLCFLRLVGLAIPGLLFISTITDYVIAIGINQSSHISRKRLLLIVSLVVNLSILGFFKYFNFFTGSLDDLFGLLGFKLDWFTLKVILPVGISFYTFQSLSYTIDVYRGHLKPCMRFDQFALYVSFFPQLVAGPIERATHLLPQIAERRKITTGQVHLGLFLILSGYCKKMIVADNLAIIVDTVFSPTSSIHGIEIPLAIIAFAFQIYCDFSGYSDIARLAKLLGFDLMINFRLPYFAISPSDFWQRWHISLSTWLRDYLYIPLGGNRCSSLRCNVNLMATMLLGGLWHGASWNFVLWGLFHGILLIAYRMIPWLKDSDPSSKQVMHWLPRMLLMFVLTMTGWVIFRCHSIGQMFDLLRRIDLQTTVNTSYVISRICLYLTPLLVVQIIAEKKRNLNWVVQCPSLMSGLIMGLMLVALLVFAERASSEFIYFQF
jgi:D-alanyl-lipoteichoic acid acyltransferase DltB (MBOAT superfamily)